MKIIKRNTKSKRKRRRSQAPLFSFLCSWLPAPCSHSGCGKKNASRTGAGMGEWSPLTERQITSFSSKSSAASSLEKSNFSDNFTPQAPIRFFSLRLAWGTRCS